MHTTLEILDRLISFNTVSARSNLALITYAESFLRARGFETRRIPDETGEKSGLYAELGPAGDGVLLSAHTDVVPVEGQLWTRNPFQLSVEDGRLYGRGTTDMKGFVASVLSLADRASRASLKEPLRIALSYDEEVGCVGIQKMLDRLAPMLGQPRLCVVGEPTEMQVAIGHKGKAGLRALCTGQAGHSALAPNFTNALYVATDFIAELRVLQSDLVQNGAQDAAYDIPYSTIHVGKLSGGTALNIVPDHAEILFEYRHLPQDRAADLMARITAAATRIETRFGPATSISVERVISYPGLDVSSTDMIVGELQALAQTNGITKVAFGTEAGFFDELGIPTLVCGPGSMAGQGHKPDEFLALSQLVACDLMMDRILSRISD